MPNTQKLDAISLWYKEVGATGGYTQLTQEILGVDAIPLPERARSTVTGKNSQGEFVTLTTFDNPPGDAPSTTINFYELWDRIHPLLDFHRQNADVFLQLLSFQNPNNVDVRNFAKQIDHYKVSFSGGQRGAGPNITGEGGLKQSNVTPVIEDRVEGILLDVALSPLTTTETADILSIDGLWRNLKDLRRKGWRGADKVFYYGAASGGTQANLLVSLDGGSTISLLTTDPTPFDGEDAGITTIDHQFISETQFRLVVGRGTLAGVKAKISYQDFTLGSENIASGFTPITIADTSAGDGIDKVLWTKYSRMYISAGSKIYVSQNGGNTDPGSPVSSPSVQINDLFEDADGNVWAVGASNTILLEDVNEPGTFTPKVGPSGGGTFTAFARAKDGIIYAGNGQKIYRCGNEAATAEGWSELYDFGSGFTVKRIFPKKGSSEIVYVIASSASAGQVWRTIDGGVSWSMIAVLTNAGYNDAYESRLTPNLLQVVGNATGGAGIIQKLS